jgi:hypothetical protein
MFAIIAAILFGLGLLLDLFDTDLGAPDLFNWNTLVMAGLFCVALHMAGIGSAWRGNWSRGRRR